MKISFNFSVRTALAYLVIASSLVACPNGTYDDPVVSTDPNQASNPIQVSSLSPMPGAVFSVAPTQVIAGFVRELDASTVNATTFILEASGNDMTFGDGNEVPITAFSIIVPGANLQSAVFDLSGVALADDTYRVRLLGSGASYIMDLDANALDGEFAGVFPSGDSTEGGDFEAQFTIGTPVEIGPTLDQIQTAVFRPTCATAACHTFAVQTVSLDLSTAGTSFLSLVGVPSEQQPAILRVAPMDPDNSYLIQKLEGAAGITGAQMPLGDAPLDQAVIDEIRQWIMDGALQ